MNIFRLFSLYADGWMNDRFNFVNFASFDEMAVSFGFGLGSSNKHKSARNKEKVFKYYASQNNIGDVTLLRVRG